MGYDIGDVGKADGRIHPFIQERVQYLVTTLKGKKVMNLSNKQQSVEPCKQTMHRAKTGSSQRTADGQGIAFLSWYSPVIVCLRSFFTYVYYFTRYTCQLVLGKNGTGKNGTDENRTSENYEK